MNPFHPVILYKKPFSGLVDRPHLKLRVVADRLLKGLALRRLVFIGVKMLIEHWMKITTGTSLAVIGGVLTTSILMSVVIKSPKAPPPR